MILRHAVMAIVAFWLLAAPSYAADRKPLVLGASGQQQQIQSGDTILVPAAKVTGISGSTQCVQASSAGLLSGTGSACGAAGTGVSRLFSAFSSVGTPANTTETDLQSYAMPGGTLASDGQVIHIRASGTFAATTRSRNVRLYFGAQVIASWTGVTLSSVTQWYFDLTLMRTGAATQRAAGTAYTNQQNEGMGRQSPTETLSGAVTIKVTGQSSGSAVANDITCDFVDIEFAP